MTRRGSRMAQVAATVGVALFWVGTAGAGALAPGYSARDDVVSSLAGRGSSVALLGIAAILASAAAHVAGWWVLRAHARWPARMLLASALATVVIAGFRVSCTDGAAGCGEGRGDGDVLDTVHYLGVLAYEVCIVVAMLAVAVGAARGRGWPRWVGVVSALAAALSVVLLVRTTGSDPGLWQRLWVATNLGWLLVTTWAVPRRAASW